MTWTDRINELVNAIANAINSRTQPAGTIALFGGATPPDGWLLCHGQVLPIAEYPTLSNVLGTQYGGDGVTTFSLPDLRDRAAVGASASKSLGSSGGADSVGIGVNNMPAHSHTMSASQGTNGTISPSNGSYLSATAGGTQSAAAIYAPSAPTSVQLAAGSSVGGGEALNVQNPYVSVHYIIYAGAL